MFFHIGEYDAAKYLVLKYHYSHRMPSNVQLVGTWHESGGFFGNYGQPVAACIFTIPPTRWSENVLELARLVRVDNVSVSLTGLISATIKAVHAAKLTDLLVSFADVSKGHHGGIYQAASWHYGGCRSNRLDGVLIDGQFIGGRATNHRYGTRSVSKLKTLIPEFTVEPHFDIGKHIYWRTLEKSGQMKATRLGLQQLPYPKPDKKEAMG